MATDAGLGGAVIADDLSGACECAGLLLQRGHEARVHFGDAGPDANGEAVIIDADLRRNPGGIASFRFAGVAYAKVDSLLRGPVRSVVQAAHRENAGVVFCNAVPALQRAVVDGVTRVDGTPLADSGHWSLEDTPPPRDIAQLLAPLPVEVLPLDVIRGDRTVLLDRVGSAARSGAVVCGDAETDDDLERIAGAASVLGLTLVGAGGLFSALARTRLPRRAPAGSAGRTRAPRQVLVIVGSASAAAREQVEELRRRGAEVHELDPGASGEWPDVPRLRDDSPAGPTVIHLSRKVEVAPSAASRRLAHHVASLVAGTRTALVLIGGETARTVLERLEISRLRAVETVDYGVLLCEADDGRAVAVRPGSFGGPQALVRITEALGGVLADRDQSRSRA